MSEHAKNARSKRQLELESFAIWEEQGALGPAGPLLRGFLRSIGVALQNHDSHPAAFNAAN